MVQSLTNDHTNLRLINGDAESHSDPVAPVDADSIVASLPMLLQTTLELPKLLSLLSDQCQRLFGPCGLGYQHAGQALTYQYGRISAHLCDYQLEIDQQVLGKISISRRYRFTPEEIIIIENVLCKAVHPLRNCLLYRHALQIAKTDTLTGLPNRQAFEAMMDREIDLAKRLSLSICLLVIDVDHFKKINDTFGHTQGDHALIDIASSLLHSLRRADITFRYGGEEFVVLLSQCDVAAAKQVAERLRQDIENMQSEAATYGPVTLSIGLAQYQAGDTPQQFFDRADKAMYQAKRLGRNQVASLT
jgi:diguanylate cyclase (GGDEF)-like protein